MATLGLGVGRRLLRVAHDVLLIKRHLGRVLELVKVDDNPVVTDRLDRRIIPAKWCRRYVMSCHVMLWYVMLPYLPSGADGPPKGGASVNAVVCVHAPTLDACRLVCVCVCTPTLDALG